MTEREYGGTGLLPKVPAERITHTGNCAGQGAVMALFSQRVVKEMEEEAFGISHVELAGQELFQELFVRYMGF